MSGDELPNTLYLVLLLMVFASSLAARRLPLKQTAQMGLAWVGIFALVLSLVAFRGEWRELGLRLKGAVTGTEQQAVAGPGGELRIPMRDDGHFWVQVEVNGVRSNFLVDSGASITTVGKDLAERATLTPGLRVAQVETANGTVVMHRADGSLRIGAIARDEFPVLIADQPGLNVLGMNFLSSLRGWRAEGRTLVLQP
ncbi:TIGR02281 family clan AA aspartic protease [Sphingomonas sp. BN140010]|uniref:TIGR02281 family clan AA aspartic protease n=1 Tax=Sphingomonas arvum TaxID=2992113 RepID=A0ABT3JEI4_9SPHN|nr:TIGR02281 family clan AA aspartic protease [Sphingomonas sp. BN140010]MCW3797490.1 TIGR02281 family clan AA aspartic protease [Sphingomonas sp. BN140010]